MDKTCELSQGAAWCAAHDQDDARMTGDLEEA